MTKIEPLSRNQMLIITDERDSNYDGIFYFGVTSTKIFCLPSCKARRPYVKNIVFFQTKRDAIEAGYRGCKRCRAEDFPNSLPNWYYAIIRYLEHHITRKVLEEELVKFSATDISTIRRYFKKNLSMTPGQFHRKIRLKVAHKLIEEGNNYMVIRKQIGFNSSSGFRSAFIKEFGYPPSQLSKKDLLYVKYE